MTLSCSELYLHLSLVLTVLIRANSLTIEPRSVWGATRARFQQSINRPVNNIIIHHSDQPGGCVTSQQCQSLIKSIQRDHMQFRNFSDIGYNFVVAGDGHVYEGRGFGVRGAHASNYNRNSIGIVFLGNFQDTLPSSVMLQNTKDLIRHAVHLGRLHHDFKILGHRQTKDTACPGQQLYNEITSWSHWQRL